MKRPHRVLITFDTHTPYLAFRVRELQKEIVNRGLESQVAVEVVLIAAEETSYKWEGGDLSQLYGGVPVTVFTNKWRGLGFRTWFKWTTFKTTWRMAWHYLKRRPKVTFAGGYDRPESMKMALLSILTRGKVGPLHDSRFNDAESYAKRIWLEWVKHFMMARYHFYMCSGRECAEYSRFLGGPRKPAYTGAWDVVDNEKIGQLAGDSTRDAAILAHLGVEDGRPFFFMPIRFLPKKNALLALDAFAGCVQKCEASGLVPARLVICGQGPMEAELREKIASLGLATHAAIKPWLRYEDVPRASRLAQALVLASSHDQWGMTINEALAAGAPVICSSRAGAHEIVRNYLNGFTFHPWDQAHLAELFFSLSTDAALVARLRSRAAESVGTFSINQFLEACFAVFERYQVISPSLAGHHVTSPPPAGVVEIAH